MGFLKWDSPFVNGFMKVVNIIFVSALWTVFCIPIFTAGTSTAAMYYTIQKCIKNDRDTVWRCFWGSFKDNFKKGTAATLILLAFGLFFFADIKVSGILAEYNSSLANLAVVFKILIFVICVYAVWIFAYMARFDGPVRMYFGNGVIFAILHLPTSIVIAILGFAAVALVMAIKPLILVVPGVAVWLMSILMERVFRKYMTDEDRALEDERNMDYRNDYAGKIAEMKKHQRELEKQKREQQKGKGIHGGNR